MNSLNNSLRQVGYPIILAVFFSLPLIIAFGIAGSSVKDIGVSLLVIYLLVIIPGFITGKFFTVSNNSSLSNHLYGTSIFVSIIILLYPLLSKFSLGSVLAPLILLFNLYFIVKYFLKQRSLSFAFVLDKKKFLVTSIFIFFGVWIGIQASKVPIGTPDQFIIEPDIYHHLTIAGEILNHGPEISPFVAVTAVPLIYHFGAYGLGAFLSVNGQLELIFSLYRITFILFCFIFLLSLYIVGLEITKSKKAGVVAVVLGALTLYPQYPIPSDFKNPLMRPVTISQLIASSLLISAIGLIMRQRNKKAQFFSPTSAGILLLSAATTLSKVSTGALFLVFAFAWVFFHLILYKKWSQLSTFISSALGFLLVLPFVFDFRAGENGLSLQFIPLETFKIFLTINGQEVYRQNLFFLSTIIILSMSLPIIIGFIFLKYKKFSNEILSLSATIFVSICFVSLFYAWGDSQWYFYMAILPLYGLLGATLYKICLDLVSNQLTPAILLLLAALIQPLVITLLERIVSSFVSNFPIIWLISISLTFTLIFILVLLLEDFALKKVISLASFALLGIGIFSSLSRLEPPLMSVGNYEHPWSITVGTYETAKFLKNNSSKDTVVLTNRHCIGPEENSSCHARMFAVTALSERRIFIEGWSYTLCPLTDPLINSFWSKKHYDLSRNVVLNPTENLIREVHSYGVEWIFLDERRPYSENIKKFADLKTKNGETSLWKIKGPKQTGLMKQGDSCV